MLSHPLVEFLGTVGAVTLPLWNIPLILTIRRRGSSRDISLAWAYGVWACLMIMLPSGFASADPVYRLFCIVNALLFSVVLLQILRFR